MTELERGRTQHQLTKLTLDALDARRIMGRAFNASRVGVGGGLVGAGLGCSCFMVNIHVFV
jgi:hypothetical protein